MKIQVTRSRTKRPRGALLQLDMGIGSTIRRIGGSQGSWCFGIGGDNGEIPLLVDLVSNPTEVGDSVWWVV